MMHQISQSSTLKQQSFTLDAPFVKLGHSHKILQSIVKRTHLWITILVKFVATVFNPIRNLDVTITYNPRPCTTYNKRCQLSKEVFKTGEHANREELTFQSPSCNTFLWKRAKQACRLIGLEVNWLEVIADSLHCCRLGMFLKTLPHVETIWSKWAKRRETMPHTNIAIERSL